MRFDYNRIDVELLPLIDQLPVLDLSRTNIEQVRKQFSSVPAPMKGLRTERMLIGTAEGNVPVTIFRKSASKKQAVLLWAHGGGYLFGIPEDNRAQQIALHCNCTVVSVDYRLAPENPFPAASNDFYNVLQWIVVNSGKLDIDPHRVAIGGSSAGGGIAAGVALRNRDQLDIPLCLQLLLYPMIDNLHATESGQIENHPFWNRKTSLLAWQMYLNGMPGKQAPEYAAVARATNLKGLPPSYLCVGTEDLFRDEGIDYTRRLISADVPCEIAVFPGLFHGADSFMPNAAVSKRVRTSYLTALTDAFA